MNQKRIRQHYTKEFKSDAVKLVFEHGYSANEVARRLGCQPSNIIDMSSNMNPLGPPPGLLDYLADNSD